MAFKNAAVLVTLMTIWLIIGANNAVATSRSVIDHVNPIKPGYITAERIKTGGGSVGQGDLADCWNALMELKSCSNEVVVFFLNGQADIGPDCCKAIDTITRHCWPAMLISLGFTAEEGNILRGYCDAASAATNKTSSAPVASPPLAAAPSVPPLRWLNV